MATRGAKLTFGGGKKNLGVQKLQGHSAPRIAKSGNKSIKPVLNLGVI